MMFNNFRTQIDINEKCVNKLIPISVRYECVMTEIGKYPSNVFAYELTPKLIPKIMKLKKFRCMTNLLGPLKSTDINRNPESLEMK